MKKLFALAVAAMISVSGPVHALTEDQVTELSVDLARLIGVGAEAGVLADECNDMDTAYMARHEVRLFSDRLFDQMTSQRVMKMFDEERDKYFDRLAFAYKQCKKERYTTMKAQFKQAYYALSKKFNEYGVRQIK